MANDDILFSDSIHRKLRMAEKSVKEGKSLPDAFYLAGLAVVEITGEPFHQVQANMIVDRIRDGVALADIFKDKRIKTKRSVFNRWVEKNEIFAKEVESAFVDWFHDQHELCIKLADSLLLGKDKDGNVIAVEPTKNMIQAVRNQIESRLKVAERLCPKRFGNTQNINHNGLGGDTNITFTFMKVPDGFFLNDQDKLERYPGIERDERGT